MTDGSNRAAVIAAHNDYFRRNLFFYPARVGRVTMTRGVAELDAEVRLAVLRAVAAFDTFADDDPNDPYHEHDFGRVDVGSVAVFWKIDYFENPAMEQGAEDASKKAYRLLTIMLREEY